MLCRFIQPKCYGLHKRCLDPHDQAELHYPMDLHCSSCRIEANNPSWRNCRSLPSFTKSMSTSIVVELLMQRPHSMKQQPSFIMMEYQPRMVAKPLDNPASFCMLWKHLNFPWPLKLKIIWKAMINAIMFLKTICLVGLMMCPRLLFLISLETYL